MATILLCLGLWMQVKVTQFKIASAKNGKISSQTKKFKRRSDQAQLYPVGQTSAIRAWHHSTWLARWLPATSKGRRSVCSQVWQKQHGEDSGLAWVICESLNNHVGPGRWGTLADQVWVICPLNWVPPRREMMSCWTNISSKDQTFL